MNKNVDHFAILRRAIVCAASSIMLFMCGTIAFADGPANSQAKEKELIALLKSEAPASDKAIACKQLAVYGSNDAVPELAKLLSNEQLASWARIALEAIPGDVSGEALRKSSETLQDNLLIGVINSIGVRRDAGAVDTLSGRLKDGNAEVASSAAVALGHIGNPAATKLLRAALATAPANVRSAVAEGCILCAERSLKEGRDAEAAEIYDQIRNAEVPKQRIVEATRGAILANKANGIALLTEQLRAEDKVLFQVALGTARELAGKRVDEALAAELGKASPERAALILSAMADRRETVILAAVLKAAEKGPKTVRIAAINALSDVGDASCLSPLVAIAAENDADLTAAAKNALGALPGSSVNSDIVARLAKADGKTYALLIELIGQRRIDAIPELLKAVENSDAGVRSAALTALGNTIPANKLSVLISQAVSPKRSDDAAIAQQALKAACIRMADRDAVSEELTKAMEKAPSATKGALLQILGAVGGTKALQTIGLAAKGNDEPLQDVSSRLLGEWSTIDAAPVLLDLAKNAPGEKYQVRALRGYIRIARQFVIPEAQRMEMCQNAFAAAHQTAEKKLVLEILKRYPTVDGLKMANKAGQIAELKDDAAQASLAIAQKLGPKGGEVLDLLNKTGMSKVKLEITKAVYGSGATQKDVTETVRKQASDIQLITLPTANYNEAFGGDPVPGAVKQLKIQFKINGKGSEATFAENALIILPMPK